MHGSAAAGAMAKKSASSGGAFIACRVPIHAVIDGRNPHELKQEKQIYGEKRRALSL
jgi:hypothetical protein